jgi:hypothetical protein
MILFRSRSEHSPLKNWLITYYPFLIYVRTFQYAKDIAIRHESQYITMLQLRREVVLNY